MGGQAMEGGCHEGWMGLIGGGRVEGETFRRRGM